MSQATRIVVTAGGVPRAFNAATVVVGRAADCDVVVEGSPVSRRHCDIVVRPDGVWLRDLESSHGTWIEGARLTQPRRVTDAVRVQLGAGGPFIFVGSVGTGPPATPTRRTGAFWAGLFVGSGAALAALALADLTQWIDWARRAAGR